MERKLARLGSKLRDLRVARGLSQEQAAERAGLHPKHVQRIENGKANPTIASVVALAIAYKVPLAKLFGA